MKELSFEQMESMNGGYTYCQLICHWYWGGAGYQGSQADLGAAWNDNCKVECPSNTV